MVAGESAEKGRGAIWIVASAQWAGKANVRGTRHIVFGTDEDLARQLQQRDITSRESHGSALRKQDERSMPYAARIVLQRSPLTLALESLRKSLAVLHCGR